MLFKKIKELGTANAIMQETFAANLKQATIKSVNSCIKYDYIQKHLAHKRSIFQDPGQNRTINYETNSSSS